ncbi:ATP synthase subunit gamma [Dirofilaria immitis]
MIDMILFLSIILCFQFIALKTRPIMSLYASIDDNILMNYPNYSLSQLLYYAVKESAALEGNSRMTAMDSVSKNIGEMIDKLTMSFNRIRQHFFACFNFLTIKTFNNDEAEKEKKTSTIPRHIKMMEGNLSVEELHLFSESSSQMILNVHYMC